MSYKSIYAGGVEGWLHLHVGGLNNLFTQYLPE